MSFKDLFDDYNISGKKQSRYMVREGQQVFSFAGMTFWLS